jgi:competence protein ComEC
MPTAFFYQTPFLRILLPFIAGILAAYYVPVPLAIILPVCCLLSVVLGVVRWAPIQRRVAWGFGLSVYLFLFAAGMCAVAVQAFTPSEETEQGVYMVVLEEAPTERENSMRAIVRLKSRKADSSWINSDEQVMLYLRKDEPAKELQQGDLLVIDATLQPVMNAGNPHEFDYRAYLNRKNIGRTTFVEAGKWKMLDHYAQSPMENFVNHIRHYLLEVFVRAGLSGNEMAVASALTLGYKAYLEDELRTAYSASGAMHVLAVSGLHVGILYLIINMLLGKITFLQGHKGWSAVIVLLLLWLYALITGMSPSVKRATEMFSIIVVGEFFRRKPFIYNSIAVSAFLLLLLRPANLFDVGFQLSYMAVLAIVFFQPKFYALLDVKNSFADKAWSLACVSMAAQIGTAPLSIYYFHQFPSYFLLTNFIVIPAASVVIYVALALFLLSPIPLLLGWLGWLFDKFLYLLNSSIFFIEKLPGSVLANIRFHGWEILLAYSCIATLCIWLISSRKTYLFLTIILCGIWMGASIFCDYRDLSGKQLVVYHTQGNSLLQFINGRKEIIWYGSRNASFNPIKFTANQRIAMKLAHVASEPLDSVFSRPAGTGLFPDLDLYASDNFIQFSGKRIVVFDPKHPPNKEFFHIDVDIAVLTGNVRTEIKDILRFCSPEIVVVDASNTQQRAKQWETECMQANIACHNVRSDGAFVFDLSEFFLSKKD